jgi:hypothetical protein
MFLIGGNPKMEEKQVLPQDLVGITKTIPTEYFLSNDIDPTRFWLQGLPSQYEKDFFDTELSIYKKGLTAVVSKITSRVLDNHKQFSIYSFLK